MSLGYHPSFLSGLLLSRLAPWEPIPHLVARLVFPKGKSGHLIPLKPFDKSPNGLKIIFKLLSICNKGFHSLALFYPPQSAAPDRDSCWPCSLSVRPLPSHRLFLPPQNASPPIFTDLMPPQASQLSIFGVTSSRQTL